MSLSKNILLFFLIFFSLSTHLRNSTWQAEMFMWLDSSVKSPLKARPYNGLGMVYSELNKRDLAIKSFRSAVKLSPDFFIAQNNLGAELFREGLYSEARISFDKALNMKYDYPEAHNNLGSVYAVTGELDKAIMEYEIAYSQNHFYIDAMLNLARAHILKSEKEKAALFLDKVLKLEPMDKEALKLKNML